MIMENEKKGPVRQVRVGGIVGSIWQNEYEGGTGYRITFHRLYKSDEGWKRTESFREKDLSLLEGVVRQAGMALALQQKLGTSTEAEEASAPAKAAINRRRRKKAEKLAA
jgi:hypothetical protein